MNTEIAKILEEAKQKVIAVRKINQLIEQSRIKAKAKEVKKELLSKEREARKNRALMANGQEILTLIFKDKSMKKFMVDHVGSRSNSLHFEGDVYIVLAEYCEPEREPADHGYGRIIGGPHLMKKGYQLVLRIFKSKDTGLDLDNPEIEYCLYSQNQLHMEDWMEANPIYLDRKIKMALLALQKKESAIHLLVTVLTDEHVCGVSMKECKRLLISPALKKQLLATARKAEGK